MLPIPFPSLELACLFMFSVIVYLLAGFFRNISTVKVHIMIPTVTTAPTLAPIQK